MTHLSRVQAASPTYYAIREMQLSGKRAFEDEPDHRPMPDAEQAKTEIAAAFNALSAVFRDTRMEDHAESVLWGMVNVLHRQIGRLETKLDANELAQQRSAKSQDGSEIRSHELESLTHEGITLMEARDAFEALRDMACDCFEDLTGSGWRPYSGSTVNRKTLTAAMIDAKDFTKARRERDREAYLPKGVRIAVTGGTGYQDHNHIFRVLDRIHAKHPDMVLLHGGASTGVDLIASKWAQNRKIAQVVFSPDFARFGKAAPFKRNDAILEAEPKGLVLFPGGNGIAKNLAQKARENVIPVMDESGGE